MLTGSSHLHNNSECSTFNFLKTAKTSEMKHYETFALPPSFQLSERKTQYSGRNFYQKKKKPLHTGVNHGLCPPNIIVNCKPLKVDTWEKFRGKLKDTRTRIKQYEWD